MSDFGIGAAQIIACLQSYQREKALAAAADQQRRAQEAMRPYETAYTPKPPTNEPTKWGEFEEAEIVEEQKLIGDRCESV